MNSPTVVSSFDIRAPSGASGATTAQRLAGTGTTGVANTTALKIGEYASLSIGAVAVRFAFASSSAAAVTASTATSPILPAYGRLDWLVSERDAFVAVEAADGGVVAFEAHVWTSSGPR